VASVGTAAVLLRAHPYGESSRVLRFYTEGLGLLGVMARGVRGRGGKGALPLPTFASGELTAFVQPHRDLHTMKDFTCSRGRSALGGHVLRFAGASSAAELVIAHVDQEPNPEIFHALEAALDGIEEAVESDVATATLRGCWGLVGAFGFAPQVDECVRCGALLGAEEMGRFDFSAGGVLCLACGADRPGPRVGPIARGQLRRLVHGRGDAAVTHPRRHLALLADFVSFHVVARPLRSFVFLADTLPPGEEP